MGSKKQAKSIIFFLGGGGYCAPQDSPLRENGITQSEVSMILN